MFFSEYLININTRELCDLLPSDDEYCVSRPLQPTLCISYGLTMILAYFMSDDVDRLTRDLGTATSEGSDQESVKSHYRKALNAQKQVRIDLTLVSHPSLMLHSSVKI